MFYSNIIYWRINCAIHCIVLLFICVHPTLGLAAHMATISCSRALGQSRAAITGFKVKIQH